MSKNLKLLNFCNTSTGHIDRDRALGLCALSTWGGMQAVQREIRLPAVRIRCPTHVTLALVSYHLIFPGQFTGRTVRTAIKISYPGKE